MTVEVLSMFYPVLLGCYKTILLRTDSYSKQYFLKGNNRTIMNEKWRKDKERKVREGIRKENRDGVTIPNSKRWGVTVSFYTTSELGIILFKLV